MPNYAPLKKAGCVLVVIDIQEKLLPAIYECQKVLERSVKMVKGARILGVPIVFTQQYSQGLGSTHADLRALIPDFSYVEKTQFNAFHVPEFDEKIRDLKAETLIFAGTEAHICVCQTALEALHRGYGVHILSDAVGSRTTTNKEIGLARIRQAGGVISGTELALYEWIGRADADEFKAILPLVK